MLASPAEPTFAHEWHSWIRAGDRWLPLMDLPYAGPVKGYLMLPAVALFGTGAAVARGFAVFLTAAGIWAIARALQREISSGVAAAAGAILAVHPAVLDQTIYDNSVVALWITTLGFVGLAFSAFRQRRTPAAAALLGFAAGIAVWCRLNFLWMLGAIAVSLLVCVPGTVRAIRDHGRPAAIGFGAGCVPVFVYEAVTRFGTARFIAFGGGRRPLFERVADRLPGLAETLLSDREHRTIWAGPAVPRWEIVFAAALAAAGVALALALPRSAAENAGEVGWRRASALTAVTFTLAMLVSGLRIAQHHLVTAVPVVAVAAVLGFRRLALGLPRGALPFVAAPGILFAALCLSWDVRASAGIRRTGGVGIWSDAIDDVTATLEKEAPGGAATALTWGLANNVFVLSGGKVAPRELFRGGTTRLSPRRRTWREEIEGGGFFLIGGAPSAAKEGFRMALSASGTPFRRWTFRERRGAVYAEMFRLPPPAPAGAPAP